MRLILMMVSLLLVSYLIFKGYSSGPQYIDSDQPGGKPVDVLNKAAEVEQLMQEAAENRRQELEKINR